LSEECLDACRFKLTVVLGRLTAGHLSREASAVERVVESPACESTIELALYCSRYLAEHRMNWSAFLVQQVSEALERIDNGSYGICLRCGQSIEVNRLTALPWVALCIGCQEGKSEYSLTRARTRRENTP